MMMKSLASIFMACCLCGCAPDDPTADWPGGAALLPVEGMDCPLCERDVEIAVFQAKEGAVTWVKADRTVGLVGWTGSLKGTEAAAAIIAFDKKFHPHLEQITIKKEK